MGSSESCGGVEVERDQSPNRFVSILTSVLGCSVLGERFPRTKRRDNGLLKCINKLLKGLGKGV